MKTILFAVAVFGSVVVGDLARTAAVPLPDERTPREGEVARLRGAWRLESQDTPGFDGGLPDALWQSVMTFGPGNTFVVHNRDGKFLSQGTFDLRPAERPAAIRFTYQTPGQPTLTETAPYTLAGDTLTIIITTTVTTGGNGPPTTTRYKTTSVYKRNR